jgi:two-component system chemotaxis sensor kinase CheA
MTVRAAAPVVLPESLLTRFRAVAYERLSRLDAAWAGLTAGRAPPGAEHEIFRDIHTLKGDARVLGFPEVALLSQRLEDVLSAARERRFRVHEDVDVVVTMAIQFIGLLLRKRAGTAKAAIDLDGFIAQVEQVTAEWLRPTSATPQSGLASGSHARIEAPARMTQYLRHRLAGVATVVFLEHLRARERSRERLREAWDALVGEIAQFEACRLGPLLLQHAATAEQLACELGKSVDVQTSGGDVCVGAEVLDALNVAVLHAVRNAVDHGIEPLDERQRLGKGPRGTIRLTVAQEASDTVEIVVADDGRGVDFDRVRRRAVERGLLSESTAGCAGERELLELLFEPAFSTRETVSEVSGRGVGLDAVRAAMGRVGGAVRVATVSGAGTSLVIRAPQPRSRIPVQAFRAPRSQLPFAVDESWSWEIARERPAGTIDLAGLLELSYGSEDSTGGGAHALVLRRGREGIAMAVAGAPERTVASRMCPTSPDEACEIVGLENGQGILLRPDVLIATAARRSASGERR